MFNRNIKSLTTVEEAYNFALNKISYREHSQKDLEEKLRLRGFSSEIIEEVIAKCKHYKLINEADYAQSVYRHWLGKKTYGRSHLKLELAKKKVAEDCAAVILKQFDEAKETERAQTLVSIFLARSQEKYSLTDRKGMANMARILAAHGFGRGVIAKVLHE